MQRRKTQRTHLAHYGTFTFAADDASLKLAERTPRPLIHKRGPSFAAAGSCFISHRHTHTELLLRERLHLFGANYESIIAVRANKRDPACMEPISTLDPPAAARHTHLARAMIEDRPCVQNGHMPPPPTFMSAYRLSLCLLTLGWSERELARRIGEHRNTVRRWLLGDSAIDPEVASWLEVLMAVHVANPGPRRKLVSFLMVARQEASPR
ncbi:helix-turn-helix transcriptional regulator (plasmid) [Lichenicola cladoniae]|uniref:Helix-turn-helix transcriptional regulator n=1 Tax=Lichenicola cladoniae TaxID=1484109 RepID=A0A6M8HY97_9PROT|nr:helix-turn-helix transcriptional regulator [Lichenicola cladoniae]NPD66321.1 helix-turn-helix transcriptional regulator [Acetobacteraceae bacterium]QKE93145.1 helix-turn-helix transcriptional regulator [Lichenicola cladoniae]